MTGLVREGHPYVGVLYLGLMLTDKGPRVIEYNVRFGDPECQPLLLRLETDLVEVIERSLAGTLDTLELTWSPKTAICVTITAPGYPGDYPTGLPIDGLADASADPAVTIFHAGTALRDGQLVSSGGRVLSVCALGDDLAAARAAAYAACDRITMPGKHLRTDIGLRTSARH
jgi:phosphoribosylamine--glycine ligase